MDEQMSRGFEAWRRVSEAEESRGGERGAREEAWNKCCMRNVTCKLSAVGWTITTSLPSTFHFAVQPLSILSTLCLSILPSRKIWTIQKLYILILNYPITFYFWIFCWDVFRKVTGTRIILKPGNGFHFNSIKKKKMLFSPF